MDFERLNGDIKEMRRRNRGLGLTVGLLAGGHLLALVVILNLLGTVRTVVVPPSINKSFWVSRDKASGEYLEQMGAFIAWLVLDVTPASIDWKKDILLGYVEPDQHGELKTRQELEAARLKRINASTFFMPQQLVPSEDTQTVVVRGRLRTLVNGLETANDAKAYEVGFAYSGGRIHGRQCGSGRCTVAAAGRRRGGAAVAGMDVAEHVRDRGTVDADARGLLDRQHGLDGHAVAGVQHLQRGCRRCSCEEACHGRPCGDRAEPAGCQATAHREHHRCRGGVATALRPGVTARHGSPP